MLRKQRSDLGKKRASYDNSRRDLRRRHGQLKRALRSLTRTKTEARLRLRIPASRLCPVCFKGKKSNSHWQVHRVDDSVVVCSATCAQKSLKTTMYSVLIRHLGKVYRHLAARVTDTTYRLPNGAVVPAKPEMELKYVKSEEIRTEQ